MPDQPHRPLVKHHLVKYGHQNTVTGITSRPLLHLQYLALHQILPNHNHREKHRLGKYGPRNMDIGMIFNNIFLIQKMKNLVIVIIFLQLIISCSTMLNQAMYDKQSKTKMLVGLSNRDGLQQAPFSGWFNKEYGVYAVNKEAVQGIDSENLSIKLFMGTWCRDSRREVPRIYRILDAAGFDESRLTLINVDRGKNSPGGEEVGLNIHHVPTGILYKNGSEIGRIIETPVQLLEEDMAAILNGTGYTPNYSDFGVN